MHSPFLSTNRRIFCPPGENTITSRLVYVSFSCDRLICCHVRSCQLIYSRSSEAMVCAVVSRRYSDGPKRSRFQPQSRHSSFRCLIVEYHPTSLERRMDRRHTSPT